MAIPSYLKCEHIPAGIWDIDNNGVPDRYKSTKYCLVRRGRHYAPKQVTQRAHFHYAGTNLYGFFGGRETNNFLTSCGFDVMHCTRRDGGGCCGGTGS